MQVHRLSQLATEVSQCHKCARLVCYREDVARVKKKNTQDQPYWGKPVMGFGDSDARLILVGLAPSAHGANRTGVPFWGDQSGQWLYQMLYQYGYSNMAQPLESLQQKAVAPTLKDAYITCAVRCVPPENKPVAHEIKQCAAFLERELELLPKKKLCIALGQLAFQAVLKVFEAKGSFAHGKKIELPDLTLRACYHPSPQNTHTKRLTHAMWEAVFRETSDFLLEA